MFQAGNGKGPSQGSSLSMPHGGVSSFTAMVYLAFAGQAASLHPTCSTSGISHCTGNPYGQLHGPSSAQVPDGPHITLEGACCEVRVQQHGWYHARCVHHRRHGGLKIVPRTHPNSPRIRAYPTTACHIGSGKHHPRPPSPKCTPGHCCQRGSVLQHPRRQPRKDQLAALGGAGLEAHRLLPLTAGQPWASHPAQETTSLRQGHRLPTGTLPPHRARCPHCPSPQQPPTARSPPSDQGTGPAPDTALGWTHL